VPEKQPTSNLEALAAKQPATLMGQLRAVWPAVERAIRAGHKLREIHKSLNESGIPITYKRLTVYRGRIQRSQDTRSSQEPRQKSLSPQKKQGPFSIEPIKESSQEVDPLVNVRKQMKNRVTWEYPSGPPDEKKLV
jgi:hypothetical protein